MKICSPQLGLSPNSVLGGEVHDHNILQGLANKGHKIFVYLPKDRPYQTNRNLIVTRAPLKHILAITFNLLVLPYLFKLYRKEKFEILRIHNPYFVGIGGLIFKIFHPEVIIVTTLHLQEDGVIASLINKLTLKHYDAVTTVSKYLKRWLVKNYKVDPKKISVVYNGVPKDLKPKTKNQLLLKKYDLRGKTVILFMGLLIGRKNPLLLLRAFKELKTKNKNLAVLICGHGPLESELRNYVSKNNLKDVIFTGAVFGKEKVDYFNLCDIFALPSKNEGFGIVAAEAMAAKKPVIASRNTSLAEIIKDNEDGLLASDEKEWIKKLESLIIDESLRKRLAQNAFDKAQKSFNWQLAVEKYELFLKSLTND